MKYVLITLVAFLLAFSLDATLAQSAGSSGSKTAPVTCLTADVIVKVLKEATPFFYIHCGLELSDLVGLYQGGDCLIEFVDKTGLGYEFKVETGGISTVIMVDSL